jgi:hypothetical protein
VNVEMSFDMKIDPFEEGQHIGPGVPGSGVVEDFTGGEVHRREQIDAGPTAEAGRMLG